jgi:muramoyltetrapeptide carboxypeptidase
MKFPNELKKGSNIVICSTARKVEKQEIGAAVKFLEEVGFNVIFGKTIGASFHQFAGNTNERVSDLQSHLDDTNIHAILFARGGYGTVHLLDKLNWTKFKENPKWLIGFSDLTAILSEVQIKAHCCCIHGPMPITFSEKEKPEWEELVAILMGQKAQEINWNPHTLDKIGNGRGRLAGGNLSVIYSLLGSPSSIESKDKILFLEDLDEYLYHIDRMMQNLLRNGIFDNLAGLIVGGMTKMNDNVIPFGKTAEEIILETVAPFNFPVAFGFPAGHISNNHPLLFGAEVEIEVTETGNRLIYK